MSNSSLVNYTKISPHKDSPRRASIKKITIHHMAGNLSVETCGNVFQSREASSNYGIGTDGRVGMYVEEKDRSWCSSNANNDNQAVTIEVANDGGAESNWHVSDTALAKLIELCVDICKRNGIAKLNYTGDANGNLTRHNMFAATTCPGGYLQSKFPYIAEQVNKKLDAKEEPKTEKVYYRVGTGWENGKCVNQKGAFEVKQNAINLCDTLEGHYVFDEKGMVIHPTSTAEEIIYVVQYGDTLAEIASEYGMSYQELAEYNGIENPDKIYVGQKIRIPVKGTKMPSKTIDELARECIKGLWGNGNEREERLTQAGYDYNAVQDRVNEILL